MEIKSKAFEPNSSIPPLYTCDGENINPPLEFTDIPSGTQSLALIVDDPDAPSGDWVHWLVFNVNPSSSGVDENSKFETPAVEGLTDAGTRGYGGPCPPSGTHRYMFKLYALDKKLLLDSNAIKEDIEREMGGHVLDQALLVGLYSRK